MANLSNSAQIPEAVREPLRALQARFPGVTIWYGNRTGRWWAMPGGAHAVELLESASVDGLIRKLAAWCPQTTSRPVPPRPRQAVLDPARVDATAQRTPSQTAVSRIAASPPQRPGPRSGPLNSRHATARTSQQESPRSTLSSPRQAAVRNGHGMRRWAGGLFSLGTA